MTLRPVVHLPLPFPDQVQSYFAEHSVSALQEAVVASERQLQHMNHITEKIFSVVASDENVPDSLRAQLGGESTFLT